MNTLSWDDYFQELAKVVSYKSKDKGFKIGCVIVGPEKEIRSTGYNGFPRKVQDTIEDRLYKPEKLLYTIHAEMNGILLAARNGISLIGCEIHVHGLHPCANCSGAIIQSGITRIVCPAPDFTKKTWSEHFKVSQIMFSEAQIQVDYR